MIVILSFCLANVRMQQIVAISEYEYFAGEDNVG